MSADKRDKLKINKFQVADLFPLLMIISFVGIILTYQVWHYGVLPYSGNYDIITIPGLMMGIQDFGRYYVHYTPDYPEPGDEINLYFDVCNTKNECNSCSNCTITAYTLDEKDNKRSLIKDQKQSEEKPITLPYHGKIIHIVAEDKGVDYEFVIPKPSFFQSCKIVLKEHPLFMIATILSPIAFIIGLFGTIICFRKEIPSSYQKVKNEFVSKIIPIKERTCRRLSKVSNLYLKKKQGEKRL